MDFIHKFLLIGLVLAGLPVVLHLIMRQKPKRLPFPAFRFLRQRYRVNQRKLNLQHLLLLLLRIAVICALCLALARPRLFANRVFSSDDRAAIVVLLFDTSASMDYTVGGVSRLDEAKARARELLGELHAGSQVAVLDSGDDREERLLSVAEARGRIEALRSDPKAGALNRPVERAFRLLEQQEAGDETPPRLLYVFSDRTRASWDAAGLRPSRPDGVQAVFVDVGVDRPNDLGIESVEVIPPVVPPGAHFEVRVRVRGTPGGHKNQLSCRVEGDDLRDDKPIDLKKDYTGDVLAFERTAPTPPADGPLDVPYQLRVSLGTGDFLNSNNTRHATFLVRRGRKLLTLVDAATAQKKSRVGDREVPEAARIWYAIHAATRSFRCDVQSLEQAQALTPQQLSEYPVICLFQVADVPARWWQRLADYVKNGGGLAIVPAGGEMLAGLEAFNDQGTKAGLLPAPLRQLDTPQKPLPWQRFSTTRAHPLLAPLAAWARGVDPDFDRDDLRPFVRRYWQVGPLAKQTLTIAAYDDSKQSPPALLERLVGQGRVVLFTSPLDVRFLEGSRTQWNNYLESSFLVVLVDRACRYLGGESAVPEMNFRCGQAAQVTLPAAAAGPFTLAGPGLSGSDRTVRLPAPGRPLLLAQAVQPGNYQVLDGKNARLAGFSLDLSPVETDLERIPAEQIEQVLGDGSVVQVGFSTSLRDELARARKPPLELLPLLMIGLLAVLTCESLLANRFYRRTPEDSAPAPLATAGEART